MPEYYNVRITRKANPQRYDASLDLTREQLNERFLKPYHEGRPIVTQGKTIPPDDIGQIEVHRTEQPSSVLLRQVRAERKASNVTVSWLGDNWCAAGKRENLTDELIAEPPGGMAAAQIKGATRVASPRRVFVIHGRNDKIRAALFSFLRSISLEPIEWSEAVALTGKPSPYVGEILDAAFSSAQAIVVLMTPDDEAMLRTEYQRPNDPPHEKMLTPQERPNVLFEAAMAMGRSPDRTVTVEIGDLRPFSDVAGRHVIRLNNTASC